MAQKKHTNERILRFSYDALTDDEIDNKICKCVEDAKSEKCNYNYISCIIHKIVKYYSYIH